MKLEELKKISSPNEVLKKAREMYGKDIEIAVSTRKDKKYMIKNPEGKWIHFGSTMEDYTKHKDNKRLEAFRNRNNKWKDNDKYSPSYLSYWLLW